MKYNIPDNIKVIFGDCRKLIKDLSDGSIALTVTSPPYNLQKNYGTYKDDVSLENWEELISEIGKEIYRVLKPNGSFFLNVSPIPDKKTKEIIPLDSIAYYLMKQQGFHLRNKIIWHFNNMQNCVNRLSGRWEAVLWFVKDIDNYIFNLKDIRVPYITKKDKRLEGGIGRNPTDVWNIDNPESDFWYFNRVNNMTKNKMGLTEHPCIYPLPMIERIIKMSTNNGDIVLDPFLGSGTTLVAAYKLDRKGIGFELDSKFDEIIQKRLIQEAATNNYKLFT
jgi:adenine-specific DNA-methyltransferase